jgi:hypothetical protein
MLAFLFNITRTSNTYEERLSALSAKEVTVLHHDRLESSSSSHADHGGGSCEKSAEFHFGGGCEVLLG